MEREPDRGTDRGSVGYERIVAFSDGVFAIAITLLVLGIDVPSVPGSRLGDAIRALGPSVLSYFIGFAVIGVAASLAGTAMSVVALALVPRLLRYTGLVQRA